MNGFVYAVQNTHNMVMVESAQWTIVPLIENEQPVIFRGKSGQLQQ